VGDPSGRKDARDEMSSAAREKNVTYMHRQLRTLWARMEAIVTSQHGYKTTTQWALCNNADWMDKTSIMEFLRTLGARTRVSEMLTRDS
jgi:tyrosyl-tRNA synthetase